MCHNGKGLLFLTQRIVHVTAIVTYFETLAGTRNNSHHGELSQQPTFDTELHLAPAWCVSSLFYYSKD